MEDVPLLMDSIGVVMTVLILGCTDTVVLALDCMLIIMNFTDVTALIFTCLGIEIVLAVMEGIETLLLVF